MPQHSSQEQRKLLIASDLDPIRPSELFMKIIAETLNFHGFQHCAFWDQIYDVPPLHGIPLALLVELELMIRMENLVRHAVQIITRSS